MPTIKRRPRLHPPLKQISDTVLAAWGRRAGDHDDDDGDVVVGGLRLVRAPDGTLVAIVEPKDPDS